MGVVKPHNYYKKPATAKERTIKVIGGSGCIPDIAYSRNLECKLPDGTIEWISSYDLEYVIDETGKKINHIEEGAVDCYLAESPADKKPVLPPLPEKHLAKRKKGR